ncbi:hypothetical protein PAXRUDRAFT_753594 [Paxillus rubicundulus Ve08.2h10]|uniref:Uncharacterized protein n=1 Tax=Paxillus rubicundulus Ve08.2h10 TaxID=930991 RepID=A0A0D0EBM0_9AGAM|nr:hypothetical protein PAXRUDRAFT_753594 [Paxillus rubicundulus Ve08.2h10]
MIRKRFSASISLLLISDGVLIEVEEDDAEAITLEEGTTMEVMIWVQYRKRDARTKGESGKREREEWGRDSKHSTLSMKASEV